MKVNCPTCDTEVEWKSENTFRPFCCERCKLIDLGEWAEESHKIAGEAIKSDVRELDEEDIEEMLAQQQKPFFKD
jgi:endogenous inhibitor of DNA gyrase (YacG/DUF329 family)